MWESFSVTLTQWLERIEGSSALSDLVTTSEQYPLDDAGLSRLELDAVDARSRCRQLQIAFFYALTELMEALKGLDEPTSQIELVPGRVAKTSWEAGGFALIEHRADALGRIKGTGGVHR